MRLLETWVETPLAGALGWTLLHSLWEGAVVSAALAAVATAVRAKAAPRFVLPRIVFTMASQLQSGETFDAAAGQQSLGSVKESFEGRLSDR